MCQAHELSGGSASSSIGHAAVEDHAPDTNSAFVHILVAAGCHPALDVLVSMDEVAGGNASNSLDEVVEAHEGSHPPHVTRVRNAYESWTGSRGCPEQQLQVGVTTDHRVE